MNDPRWVVLQVTEKCNLRCKMCYEWGDNGSYLHMDNLHNLDVGQIDKILHDLSPYKIYYELFGGEPLLHPQIAEILKLLKKYHCVFDIPTNGTLLEKYAEDIVDAQVRRIWISLDGPEEINDAQRGKNVYKRAMQGIKKLKQVKEEKGSKRPLIGATFVVTPLNYVYLKDFVMNELVPLNLDYVSIEFQLYITQQRHAAYHKFLEDEFQVRNSNVSSGLIRDLDMFKDVDIDNISEQMTFIRKYFESSKTKLIGYPKFIDKENLRHFYNGEWDLMKESKSDCPFPWAYMEISAAGDVTPCHTFYDLKMGNVYDKGIMEIWRSKEFSDFRQKMHHKITPICCACSRYYN